MLKGCAQMRVFDCSALNHIDFSTEDALQTKFELEVPVKESMIPFKFNEHINVT